MEEEEGVAEPQQQRLHPCLLHSMAANHTPIMHYEDKKTDVGLKFLLQHARDDSYRGPFTLADVHTLVNHLQEYQCPNTPMVITEFDIDIHPDNATGEGIDDDYSNRFFTLVDPPDGGLDVLCDFFANDTTLTKVGLTECVFGGPQEASRIVAALERNHTVTDLSFCVIQNLDGVALGRCISSLLENNATLQKLSCYGYADAVRTMQPGLRFNRTLQELGLRTCVLGDEDIRLVADALVDNTTLLVLDIACNDISPNGLVHITRIIVSTQLLRIDIRENDGILDNEDTTRSFARALSQSHLTTLQSPMSASAAAIIFPSLEHNTVLEDLILEELRENDGDKVVEHLIESLPRMNGLKWLSLMDPDILRCIQNTSFLSAFLKNTSLLLFSEFDEENAFSTAYPSQAFVINHILQRNSDLNVTTKLLALQPGTGLPIGSKSGMWSKIFANFNLGRFGASPIFYILQNRPTILQPQLQRLRLEEQAQQQPTVSAAAVAPPMRPLEHDDDIAPPPPLTWLRQVLELTVWPDDMGVDHPMAPERFPADAIERAREMKTHFGGHSLLPNMMVPPPQVSGPPEHPPPYPSITWLLQLLELVVWDDSVLDHPRKDEMFPTAVECARKMKMRLVGRTLLSDIHIGPPGDPPPYSPDILRYQVLALVDWPNDMGVDHPRAHERFPAESIACAREIKSLGAGRAPLPNMMMDPAHHAPSTATETESTSPSGQFPYPQREQVQSVLWYQPVAVATIAAEDEAIGHV